MCLLLFRYLFFFKYEAALIRSEHLHIFCLQFWVMNSISGVPIKYCSCLPPPLSVMTWCLIDDILIDVGGRLAGDPQMFI